MSITRIKVDPNNPDTFPKGRINPDLVDGTTEAQIARQQREDEQEAMQDIAINPPDVLLSASNSTVNRGGCKPVRTADQVKRE